MQVTAEILTERYRSESTEELIRLHFGDLDELARPILEAELSARGVTPETLAAFSSRFAQRPSQVSERPSVGRTVFSWALSIVAIVVVLVIANTVLYGLGLFVAPQIWSAREDRSCQKEGYWYSSGGRCVTWVLVPGRSRGRPHK